MYTAINLELVLDFVYFYVSDSCWSNFDGFSNRFRDWEWDICH